MRLPKASLRPGALLFVFTLVFPLGRAAAQVTNIPERIVSGVDGKDLFVLKGNVHPLARPAYDQGVVPDGQPLHRMLLLLQRSPDQESALRQLLDDQQSKSSPNYRAWLTPEQFGKQFGPADADMEAVTQWLTSQGFADIKVGPGRTVIEFSGNVAQVRNAFHTQIHQYMVKGETHMANATDPQIPAALSPVVAGIVSLNNFPAKSFVHRLGTFQKSSATGEIKPLFSFPGCKSGNCFAVGPPDFATIYNTAPLLSGSPKIDGTGQTIAIVGESNINVQDVVDFRTVFGLPQNFTAGNVILNGTDPGINGTEIESDLDVQWSGGVAPGATIDFVTSAPTETTEGIDLSAVYIVDHNLAGVMSESFGGCEQQLGTTLNQFYNSLWEQAAAQGITVMLSTGDGGSAGCDNFNITAAATLGLGVNGLASTPFNVAVGGTDFDQAGRESQFWSTTPTSTTPPVPASALKYIPEVPWNDSCAQNGLNGCSAGNLLNIIGGSGGVSTIYAKPSWQTGVPGVPNDNHRDLPDVSLFASNGFNGSFYIICERDATSTSSCNLNNFGFTFQGVGGTSASAPAFAGIMALVNQRQATPQNPAPRQGNANYVLYALAQKSGASCNSNGTTPPPTTCTFNDVTKGNNAVPCAGRSPNCSSSVSGVNGVLVEPASQTTPAYPATAGYDLATGLGSVNAQNLVNNWSTVSETFTTTALTLNNNNAVSVSHGTSVPVSVTVSPSSATGDVSLIADLGSGKTVSFDTLTLGTSGTASGTTTALPGGTGYQVHAHYPGDGTNAPSDSTPPVSVTVTAESSKTLISVPVFDPSTGRETGNKPTALVYGSPYIGRIDVGNANAVLSFPPTPVCTPPSCPTGTITWTDSLKGGPPTPLDGGSFALNISGFAEDLPIQLSGGAHQLSASYSGDNSYTASSASYSLTVIPAPTSFTIQLFTSSPVVAGAAFQIFVNGISQTQTGLGPTGTITFFDGTTQLGSPVTINGNAGQNGSSPSFSLVTPLAIASGGAHTLSAHYSGDTNYASSTSPPFAVNVVNPTTASITVSPSTVNYGSTVTITAIVDSSVPMSNAALKPTGTISLNSGPDGQITTGVTTNAMADANGNWEIQATATITPSNSEVFFLSYSGDNNYGGASASSNFLTVIIPDFTLGPAGLSVVPVAGQAGSGQITVTPVSPTQMPSTVTLSLPPLVISGYAISFSPQQVSLNGAPATATILLTPASVSPGFISTPTRHAGLFTVTPGSWWSLSFATGLATLYLLGLPDRRRRYRAALGFGLVCLLCIAMGCSAGGTGAGGGGSSQVPTTITLTTSNAKAAQNQPFLITATVTSSKPLTGTVTFYNFGTRIVGGIPLANGQAQTGGPGYINGPGLYQVTATYSGDADNLPSTSAALTQVITGTFPLTIQGHTGGDVHSLQLTLGVQ